MTTQTQKATPDWEFIETAYRAGVLSLRQVATQHGISDTAIRKRAKRDGWTRDLSAKVRAKADDLVRSEVVHSEVRKETACEREVIEANAQMQADVVLSSRRDIQKARALVMRLLDELERMTAGADLLVQLGELMLDPVANAGKLQEAYKKIISLPSRIDAMRKLADALKTLIALEREAFGIDPKKTAGQTLDEFLDGLAAVK